MYGNLVVLFLALAVAPAFAVPSASKRTAIIGDNLYFTDTAATRNRTQALAFCISQGGELAKVTGAIYKVLQVIIPVAENYWIDGSDKTSADRFEVNTDCTDGTGKVDFTGIPAENLEITVTSCLSYVKGATVALSKLKSIPCSTALKGVLCSFPLSGCKIPPTPAP